MSTRTISVTDEELEKIVEVVVERKLLELLRDPDKGLEIRNVVRRRLRKQKAAVAGGERGKDFQGVVRQLGLE